MADVNAPGRRGDRAQMLLVAAFGIAVMLVALALILNTSIYTENIATRGSDISGGKDAARYRDATRTGVAGAVEFANYNNNSSYPDLEEAVDYSVANYSNVSGKQQSLDSIATNVEVESKPRGAHVFNRSGNFSNATGTRNWTVVENTEGVREFDIEADNESLTAMGPPPVFSDPIFFVNFTDRDDDEFYAVFVFNDDSGGTTVLNVTVEGRTESGSTFTLGCDRDVSDGTADVSITGGTVEGERCKPLERVSAVTSDQFSIRFNNTLDGGSPTIEGNYTMFVNSTRSKVNPEAPNRERAIYSARVHVFYHSKRLFYETDIRVAPGEFDE